MIKNQEEDKVYGPCHGLQDPLISGSLSGEEEVDNMGGEVNAEPDGDDKGHASENIHGESPEVHETGYLEKDE